MKKSTVLQLASAILLLTLTLGAFAVRHRIVFDIGTVVDVARPPGIRPDYRDLVVPPNIAPLNFMVEEPGTHYRVQIRSAQGAAIDVTSRSSQIAFPLTRWRQLLAENRGGKLYFDVYVRREDGQWTRFAPIENTVADADIDNYLCYRLIKPLFILRVDVAIYQRDVRTFEEATVVSNRTFKGGCINCHTFAPRHPGRMILQSRDEGEQDYRNGTIVVRDGKVFKADTRQLVRHAESDRGLVTKSLASYAAWHPNGRVVAYSANEITQFFHDAGENRDVFDSASDLALYDVDSNTVTTAASISRPDRLETFPAWSPDGRYLYFCSAEPRPRDRYREVRYDLVRVSYDPERGECGDVEPVVLAKDTGRSVAEPRVSPDGRWLLFCMSDYGAFPVFQPSSDLYLLDLQTRQHRRLEVNSPRSDSWHCWSSNGRWIAFASKRADGLFARVYFSYVDEEGRVHKPVLLPQKDPSFYDRFIKTYNAPELTPWPAPASGRSLVRAIQSRDSDTAGR
ncbi:MAG: cytochrome C biosynthesis protein [Candidatus Anammoximicrobium sp.]|nr:cytochrome C biosynthesis protein [Candidatus Anammoximicrobium sp.]